MDFSLPEELDEIRAAVRELCARFPGEYWRELEPDRYPEEFVAALTEDGWLAALIPEEYGGAGLGAHGGERDPRGDQRVAAATRAPATRRCTRWARSSGTARDEQKQRYLPRIASGELRLQAFGVTEPTAGSDTTAHPDDGRRASTAATSSAARRSGRRARCTPT